MSTHCAECGRPFAENLDQYIDNPEDTTCGLQVSKLPWVAEDCLHATVARLKARVLELESWRPLSEESTPQPFHHVVLAGSAIKAKSGVVVHWIQGELLGPKGSCWWYQLPRLPEHLREFER